MLINRSGTKVKLIVILQCPTYRLEGESVLVKDIQYAHTVRNPVSCLFVSELWCGEAIKAKPLLKACDTRLLSCTVGRQSNAAFLCHTPTAQWHSPVPLACHPVLLHSPAVPAHCPATLTYCPHKTNTVKASVR